MVSDPTPDVFTAIILRKVFLYHLFKNYVLFTLVYISPDHNVLGKRDSFGSGVGTGGMLQQAPPIGDAAVS